MAAHLKGAGNAMKWYRDGIDSKDGNGTRISDYARTGENSLSDVPLINFKKPIGGNIISNNLTRQQEQIVAARQLAQNHTVNNTEVMVQTVHIQTAADTMRGVGSDMVNGIRDKLNQFNMGMI